MTGGASARTSTDWRWWITTNLLVGRKVAGPYPSRAVAEAFRSFHPNGEHLFSATER